MRHFAHLPAAELTRLFHHPPADVDRHGDPQMLAVALGATLYSPATRPTLAADITRHAARGATSMVVDLEDALADEHVEAGERNAAEQLRRHHAMGNHAPLLFIRVREPGQIQRMLDRLGPATNVLTGFVIPKFGADNGEAYLSAVAQASANSGVRLLAMPVLESPDMIYRESRKDALVATAHILNQHREHVLALRLGATDLCSAYGLRRPRDMPIYDLHLVAEVIADIVNVFGRVDGTGFTISGPVWEYFSKSERMFKPQLRESPFVEHDARAFRQQLIADGLDGLIREVILDQANGLTGKTVIHPTHVAAVNALSVVGHEDFCDASDILGHELAGGVRASRYANKMNEMKPHEAWARRVTARAAAFGVAAEGVTFVDLLEASVRASDRVSDHLESRSIREGVA